MSDGMYVGAPEVLMVDDEQRVADAYALRLEDVADVSVAYGGDEALGIIDDDLEPHIVLLDRHMPSMSGDDVLAAIRDRDLDTRVIMVTAVDPGLDVLDLPFDDYLAKPVDRADLLAAVDQQCQVLAFELLGEYFTLASKQAIVRAQLPQGKLDEDDRLAEIEERLDEIETRVRDLLPDAGELLTEFSGIDREG